MSKHWHLITFLVVLLLAVPAFAQGDRGDQPSGALSICNDCSFTISIDTSAFGDWSEDYTLFEHSLYIDADGQDVDELYVTFFFHSTLIYYRTPDYMFEPYDVFNTVQTDDGIWVHYEWTELDSLPTVGNPMMSFSTYGPICHDEQTALQIEFKDSAEASWHNQFHATAGVQDPGQLIDGYQWFYEPEAEVTVVGPDDETGDTVAIGYRGGVAEVPLWLDTVTFDFYTNVWYTGTGYYEITVGVDDGLEFYDFDETAYSGYLVQVDTSVDNEITLRYGSWAGYTYPTGDKLFGTLLLYVDPDVTAEEEDYRVWLKGVQTFQGCVDFGTTFTNTTDTVMVWIPEKEAGWRIAATSKCRNLQDYGLPFYLKTNALVYTDVGVGAINAAFTFDSSYLDYTTFDEVTSQFSYNGGTMYWNCVTTDPPNVQVFEDPFAINPSTTVKVTGDYEQIGQLVLDLADVVYTESLVFVNDEEYDNYVVFTYDEDTLDGFDDNMTLVNGAITTYTCGGGGGGGTCPAVYVWTGKTFTLQDYVLTHSQTQLSASAADDYLPISYGIAEEDGYYRIQIREFENEVTFLDQVELIVAEYPSESDIGISVAGDIFTHHEDIAPIAAEDQFGNDVLALVGAEDGVLYEAEGPGSLTLTYRNASDREDSQGFGVSLLDAPPKEILKSGTATANTVGDYLYAEIEDASGNWHYMGGIPPREHSSATSQWTFDSYTSDLGETFRVKITWTREYTVDCQTLQLQDNASVTEHHLTPVEATHTAAGKVGASLIGTDKDIITITPGETLELTFKAPERIRGYYPQRAFFLKTHGYYESMSMEGRALPEEYSLDDNYPNPFNPSTNIGLSLPQREEVTLRVFNLLGQEVRTVFQGELDQGHHVLTWHGDNNSGEAVASGVYFYRLETKDFTESKKMMLLK